MEAVYLGGILFVSSNNTGYGHRSITESLGERISEASPLTPVHEADGFMLGGRLTGTLSRMYNTVAVNAPLVWRICYSFGNICPSLVNFFSARNIRKGFEKLVIDVQPGLIVVVHPGFVSPVIDILERMRMKIPVVVMVADLDNVSCLWADKRAQYIICPTENARQIMLEKGVPEEKIKVFGFPVRRRFCDISSGKEEEPAAPVLKKDSLIFLLMNGSQGVGCLIRIARILLKNFKCLVIILAGKNRALRSSLEKNLIPEYRGKVTICGFIENVEHYMSISDILIIRASPNVLIEAVNVCKPVIITGALTGQEEKNPKFVEDNKLGVVCEEISRLPDTIRDLLADDCRKLMDIRTHQQSFRQPDAAREIAAFLLDILKGGSL